MIEIRELTKNYGFKRALDKVDLTLRPGELVGLFGENGAGKTTLMKCILGLLPCSGSITLDSEKITRKNIERLSFATSEHSFFPDLTAAGHRDFYKMHFPRFRDERYRALMEFFSLPAHRLLRQMSTGQKNQFEVILALSQGADYILMDEPFAGNDIFNREDFYKVLVGILEPTETILLSTHLIEEVEPFISRAVVLREGKVASDVASSALDEQGVRLTDFIKSAYGYRADRVGEALYKLTEQEDHDV